MFEVRDNLDLYEEEERKLLEELSRMSIDDPKRPKVMESLEDISRIRVAYKEQEETRLNNNARVSIDEERLNIEKEKLKNDKTWGWIGLGVSFAGMTAGGVWQCVSYYLDEKRYAYKPLKTLGEKTLDAYSKLKNFLRR